MWADVAQATRLLTACNPQTRHPEGLAEPGVGEGGSCQIRCEGVAGVILGTGNQVAVGADMRLDEGGQAMAASFGIGINDRDACGQ